MDKDLLFKYNIPGPRYTSYPTVPYWQKDAPTQSRWEETVWDAYKISNQKEGISLYIHLPYCESLCTYCGCNTRITINHAVEEQYIRTLLKEWSLYKRIFEDERPIIKEIHLGGGTPTFFSPKNLTLLITSLLADCDVHPQAQFSFEAHPGNTTDEHLTALYQVGFRRISIGVQDFNPAVLAVINRHQTFEQVKHLTEKSREIGYTSVNYDVIYGLPLQKSCYIMETMMKVVQLKPDRIAYYSYAHVPWIKPGQRRYTEADLPDPDKKMALYETGKNALELAGYKDIGMDHFALEKDSLYQASINGNLHRNFMGYTDAHTQLLIGLGASSISDTWWGFAQNEKKIEDYTQRVNNGKLPIFKGHLLTKEDLILRKHILNLMTRFETTWQDPKDTCDELYEGLQRLEEMQDDGLVEITPYKLQITEAGRSFIRNACMALDARLRADSRKSELFSKTI
ncbi:oxygen-independent coproporphyrinogen-3 oxidase [Dyadobacter jejuensis]|uniref:Coproporphyrinogen-III oxidase n=1 Tax=Dyadobacter jejuensis TaxID=1082580 RepID=A0A316B9P8_9BACT|nr:oxygen-independent coproporphyrinogen III oxidase [Dyadobacter jejuensis]PWJ59257.1 oxygen-independent coproporphyrinogen-3 oxidase [Dyadobacter jejuensis]